MTTTSSISTTTSSTATATTAAGRQALIQAFGLESTVVDLVRNGEIVKNIGRLVARDAAAEAKGCFRAPHGAEADALFRLGTPAADEAGAAIALERARSNGRNVFWGKRHMVSSPEEVREHGAIRSRELAVERAAQWAAHPNVGQVTEAWAFSLTPADYCRTPSGKRWEARWA